jgi:hypothetical protein
MVPFDNRDPDDLDLRGFSNCRRATLSLKTYQRTLTTTLFAVSALPVAR